MASRALVVNADAARADRPVHRCTVGKRCRLLLRLRVFPRRIHSAPSGRTILPLTRVRRPKLGEVRCSKAGPFRSARDGSGLDRPAAAGTHAGPRSPRPISTTGGVSARPAAISTHQRMCACSHYRRQGEQAHQRKQERHPQSGRAVAKFDAMRTRGQRNRPYEQVGSLDRRAPSVDLSLPARIELLDKYRHRRRRRRAQRRDAGVIKSLYRARLRLATVAGCCERRLAAGDQQNLTT